MAKRRTAASHGKLRVRSGRVVRNAEIAAMFEQLADLLDIEGANPFRVRAYRNAARLIAGWPRESADMIAAGEDLAELPAIGEDLAEKIAEIVRSGRCRLLDDVAARTPAGLAQIVSLPGIGPKRARLLHERLGVKDLEDLAAKVSAGAASSLPGIGPVTLGKIAAAIRERQSVKPRMKLADAERQAEPLAAFLRGLDGVVKVVIAGSYRRRRETVGDIDLLAICAPGRSAGIIARFTGHGDVAQIISSGMTRATVILHSGLQADLRVVAGRSYGSALAYFTGSKEHNIALRAIAAKKGLKLNEYGAFKGEKQIAGRSEEGIYELLGMDYIPPELRENRGEIDAARKHRLPKLITLGDIRGDLHVHTIASDGTLPVAAMAAAARKLGYGYIAITDHSRALRVAHGLDDKRLLAQTGEIDRLSATLGNFRILKSCEVDILVDGKLDIGNDTLRQLDFVYGAIHSHFDLPREKQTERIIRAMDNPFFSILAHPTGRLINARPPCEIDMERVMAAAAERGCAIEINAQPDRLDMSDVHCRMAKEAGVKIVIATDSHSAEGLGLMRFGVDQARRGWLTSEDVLNTRPVSDLLRMLRR
jgi:DNA polymerase (family 10)